LRKATVLFAMSVCLHGTTQLPLGGLLCNVNYFRRVCNFAKSYCSLRYVCLSAWNDSAPTGWTVM